MTESLRQSLNGKKKKQLCTFFALIKNRSQFNTSDKSVCQRKYKPRIANPVSYMKKNHLQISPSSNGRLSSKYIIM
jgi:hypothetical protein